MARTAHRSASTSQTTSCGFSFVLRQLPRELLYLRQRPGEAVALVVVIDGDAKGSQERLSVLRTAGGPAWDVAAEQLAPCIACRNIETWILWLNGEREVEEVSDFKRQVQNLPDRGNQLVRQAVLAWFQPADADLERERVPALAEARHEIDRLARRFTR